MRGHKIECSGMQIREAFDSLDLPFSFSALIVYMADGMSEAGYTDTRDLTMANLIGLTAAAIITFIEAEREGA